MLRLRTGLLLLTGLIFFTGVPKSAIIPETGNVYDYRSDPEVITDEKEEQEFNSIPERLKELLQKVLFDQWDSMNLTEMEALDRVKERYATNFMKVPEPDSNRYYYKLQLADYYLVSEGMEGNRYYLIHLYEFVVDEEDSGIGHTVTYGWYVVNRWNGAIEERMNDDR